MLTPPPVSDTDDRQLVELYDRADRLSPDDRHAFIQSECPQHLRAPLLALLEGNVDTQAIQA